MSASALDRWGKGDPGGFLELYANDITYFDPLTATRIDGHPAMVNYYRPWVGKLQIARYEMLNPQVVVDGDMALLTYNLVNYIRDPRCRVSGELLEFNDGVSAPWWYMEGDPLALVVHLPHRVSEHVT